MLRSRHLITSSPVLGTGTEFFKSTIAEFCGIRGLVFSWCSSIHNDNLTISKPTNFINLLLHLPLKERALQISFFPQQVLFLIMSDYTLVSMQLYNYYCFILLPIFLNKQKIPKSIHFHNV